jgi:CheY-like chemotaxis protein
MRNASVASTPDGILVVDDHEATLDLLCSILRSAGFSVSGASSGAEGLVRIAEDPTIGLLITDIIMPGRLDGWRLAESSKALRADLRIIYITANSKLVPTPAQGPGLGPLVPKPCAPAQLIAGVQRALGRSPGPRRHK